MACFKIFAFSDEAGDSLSQQISALNENGLDGTEIRGVGGKNIIDYSHVELKDIKKMLDGNGLVVWSIGSPIGKVGINEDFNEHLDSFKKTLETALILGAENIRLFSFFTGENPDECKNEVIDRLGAFCETAEGSGVTLCHENEKDIYGDIAKRCLEIHKTFPQIKAIFDPANYIQCGQDTLSAWEMTKQYVKYIHVKDALADGTVVPAGDGIGNLETILKKYKQAGGEVLTLEPHLFDFIGSDKLERASLLHQNAFSDSREAFDCASDALKRIISRI